MNVAAGSRSGKQRGDYWQWLSLIPFGPGAIVPIYAGIRARVRLWILLGVLFLGMGVAGWIVSGESTHHGVHQDSALAGMLLVFSWIGAVATSFAIKPSFDRRMDSPFFKASRRAAARLGDRRHAKQLVAHNPQLAREMGVGRPDLPGAAHAGLVDVNHAPAKVLTRLAGVDEDLAARIVQTREQAGGFSSLEDLGLTLDLDGDHVERLRERAIFLPG